MNDGSGFSDMFDGVEQREHLRAVPVPGQVELFPSALQVNLETITIMLLQASRLVPREFILTIAHRQYSFAK